MRGKVLLAAIAAMLVWPAAASAQQVTGLTATQEYGFTTLKWTPVPNATDYQIERQSVDANDAPIGTATIVGLWQPIRTITRCQSDVRGVRLHARRPLPVARARAAGHDESAAVLGARRRDDAGPLG